MNKRYPRIIGISGVTGAGKTTLAHALAENLKSTLLNWDDFDNISTSPADYVEWYHRRGSYNEWDYQALADVLHTLKSNKSVLHPVFKDLLQPTEYIIFDAPLGHQHVQTGQYIDICIHLSVPLDVSLCRRLIRDEKEKTKEELITDIKYYLSESRHLYFDDDLKKNADFLIDGMLKIEDQIKKIKELI